MAVGWKVIGGVMLNLIGIRTAEEPAFAIITRLSPEAEIRLYAPRLAAETAMEDGSEAATDAAFRRLAGYIFGANSAKGDIAMTAPVETSPEIAMTAPVETATRDGKPVMRFFLPAALTRDKAPAPDDPAVLLTPVPEQKLAVLRFSGGSGPERVAEKTAELRALLSLEGQQTAAPARLYRYDPPMTPPFLRRNEVAIPLD
ncbi:MAG: heme-binding protein [Hyphomicrobiales bacterium]|nr:heme-binding protein [Hyphomicrobiales bacterium]OQW81575.1 MAG: hypothetical protein BVN31_10820 [Proteobacteria bacterium ST_bin15]